IARPSIDSATAERIADGGDIIVLEVRPGRPRVRARGPAAINGKQRCCECCGRLVCPCLNWLGNRSHAALRVGCEDCLASAVCGASISGGEYFSPSSVTRS